MSLHAHNIESFGALADVLGAPVSPAVVASIRAPAGTGKDHDASWSGDMRRSEFADALRHGWPNGLAQMVRDMQAIDAPVSAAPRRTVRRDVAGSSPCVGAALAGDPRSMRRRVSAPRVARVLRVVIHVGARHGVTRRAYECRGAAIASWIDAQETAGTRCDVVAVRYAMASTGDAVMTTVRVKEARDALDIGRIALLGHAGFQRVAMFAAAEVLAPEFSIVARASRGASDDVPPALLAASGCDIYFPVILEEYRGYDSPEAARAEINRIAVTAQATLAEER